MFNLPAPTWPPLIQPPYLVLDTEFLHLDRDYNHVVLVGFYLVQDQTLDPDKAVDMYIRTPYDPAAWGAVYLRQDFQEALKQHGLEVTDPMRAEIDARYGSCLGCFSVPPEVSLAAGKYNRRLFQTAYDVHQISPADTLTRGHDRESAIRLVHRLLSEAKAGQWWVVGHNLLRCDIPALQAEMKLFGLSWEPDPERTLDTGLMVKALQMNWRPRYGESLYVFLKKISDARRRIKWALDSYCVPAYGLEKYGVDTSRQHKSAGYDCFVVACLLKELCHGQAVGRGDVPPAQDSLGPATASPNPAGSQVGVVSVEDRSASKARSALGRLEFPAT